MPRAYDTPLPRPDDRRDAVRLPCPLPTTVQLTATPGLHRLRVHIRDVSVKGAGLLSAGALEPGVRLDLHWSFGPAGRWRTVHARVTHATPYDDGGYLVGCEFDEPLGEEEVSLVVCRFSPFRPCDV